MCGPQRAAGTSWVGRRFAITTTGGGGEQQINGTGPLPDSALTQEQIQSLMTGPGGDTGVGNVVSYGFEEEAGKTVVDSSGNGRDGTVETPLAGERPSKVFKHRHVATDFLIPWKDQQVFMPFVEGNNFSNINSTLQAQVFAKSLREYRSE